MAHNCPHVDPERGFCTLKFHVTGEHLYPGENPDWEPTPEIAGVSILNPVTVVRCETCSTYEAIFELGYRRTMEAAAHWQAEDMDSRRGVTPDMGTLIGWLMAKAGLSTKDGA